jgi:hypothetical protein
MSHSADDRLPDWDLSPEATAARRAELEADLERRGVEPHTPEELEDLRRRYPPPSDAEFAAFLAAIQRP